MGYLDKSGLSRLWSKIKSYVTNHHMDVTTNQSTSGTINLQFGDTWSNPSLYAIGTIDKYGHTTAKVSFPGFTLPTVDCGVFSHETNYGPTTVKFTKLNRIPKLIRVYNTASGDTMHPHGLCAVWIDGKSVVSTGGQISSVTTTGFTFGGLAGEHYWEAWG